MKKIELNVKPESGRIARICKVCNEPYIGWNFVSCIECEIEHNYTVEYNWSKNNA